MSSSRAKKSASHQRNRERLFLWSLAVAILATIAFGVAYQQQYFSEAPVVVKKLDKAKLALSQSCQQKLQGFLDKGGVDIANEMHYGDLQGCDFSSASEQVRKADASDRSFRLQ